ncbi:hypothetical protein FB45DRAFT_426620 [Roridomyces roridus]|uniref:F-box domain-containing protein n=1 Tax=Roridomyces roridus TaxID=1738132 RepID=A0AAD7FUE8_9AGAR|nr:hypothetical protein FB45DRAFT_426620 [Roridomyces roridus]
MIQRLAADRALVAELECRMLDLERSLAELRKDKELVQERLDSYTYPVLNLPNEITALIFVNFLPSYPVPPPFQGPLSPLHLTQICRKWRDIALACPTLWRAIKLPRAHGVAAPQIMELADRWLSRSGCGALSIGIDGSSSPAPETLALKYRARWEFVRLYHEHDCRQDFRTLQGPMPLLRDLDVSSYRAFVLTRDDAPLLRAVRIRRGTPLTGLVMPWVQLTWLKVDGIEIQECVPILQQASNLTSCGLRIRRLENPVVLPDIHLPFLKTLRLLTPHKPVLKVLNALVVPKLRHLSIEHRALGTWPVDTLAALVSKSGCRLQLLRIYTAVQIPEGSLQAYRNVCPSAQIVISVIDKRQ